MLMSFFLALREESISQEGLLGFVRESPLNRFRPPVFFLFPRMRPPGLFFPGVSRIEKTIRESFSHSNSPPFALSTGSSRR